MKRILKFREQVQRNMVALISVFIAVSSLSYNTWRNEKTEYNRNQRQASFEVLLKLGELRELVYHLHFDRDSIEEHAERTGWALVFTIQDLAQVLEAPVPDAAASLYTTWDEHWDGLGVSGADKNAIEEQIDAMRESTRNVLEGLD